MIHEARCRECGETFNPADEGDLIHQATADGEPCGGQGVLVGVWSATLQRNVTIPEE